MRSFHDPSSHRGDRQNGQVVTALMERTTANKVIIPVSRPELDLTEPKTVVGALDRAAPDIIVNTDAYTMIDKAEQEPETAHRVNAEGAATVARVAKELGVPLIHLSTDYIFNDALDQPYREDDLVNPQGAYGRSKL